jgi:ubiquinone biosynthesis protein
VKSDADALSLLAPSTPPPPRVRAIIVKRKRARDSYRFLRAYYTTYRVLSSYLWLGFKSRFFGRAYYDQRIDGIHRRSAERVHTTIVELQGLFIKVGQLLSVLANFLPAHFRSGLASLQDRVPARPTSEIRSRIQKEFDAPLEDLFLSFSDEPMASASLGQVHEARLRDGTRVAVKVQHVDINDVVRLDLSTIRRIMRIVALFVPVKGLDVYYRQIKQMIAEELDFEAEARNIERIMRNFSSDPSIVFPRPIAELSSRTVMTTTFVDGIQVGDLKRLDEAKIDRKALARKIVEVFCQQIFVDGVYHADPHPGNMLAGPNGELILLDFGAVAQLSTEMKEGIPEFIEGIIRRDTERLIRSLKKMGFIARNQNEDISEKVIEFFHQRFQEDVKLESFNLKDIKIDPKRGLENFLSLRKMNIGLRELSETFHVPRDWVYLERTILLLTGVCTQLDPNMTPVEIIRPYVENFVLGNRDWAQIALESAKDMALKAITLPDDLRKYLTKANRGDIEVKVRELPRAIQVISNGVRQLVFTFIAIGLGLGALQVYIAGHIELATKLGWASGAAFGLVVLIMLFGKVR